MSITTGLNLTYRADYPIPGVDQSSQQFRDNFAVIQRAIENLQRIASTADSVFDIRTFVSPSDGSITQRVTLVGNAFSIPIGSPTIPVRNGMIRLQDGRVEVFFDNHWNPLALDRATGMVFKNGLTVEHGGEVKLRIGERVDVFSDLAITSTGSLRLPAGTISQRPPVPINGMMRYNVDDNAFEFRADNRWIARIKDVEVTGELHVFGEPTTGTHAVNLAYLNGRLISLGEGTSGDYVQTIEGFEGIKVAGAGVPSAIAFISLDTTDAHFTSGVRTVVGQMITSNIERGIQVTYDSGSGKINFDIADFNIDLVGAIQANSTVTNNGSTMLATSISEDAVQLGFHTSGNYVETISGTNAITVAGSGTESATVTVGLDTSDPGFVEAIEDIVGNMVTSNLQNGIAVSYDDTGAKLNFDVADFDITLAGAITGTGTVTDLANVTINTTLDTEVVQDIIGAMVDTNVENGIAVTYDNATGKIVFDVADFDVTLAGAVTGTATITDLTTTTITTALDPASVQAIVGAMVDTNIENGIAVTFDSVNGKLDFDVADFDVTLAGAVIGTGTVTDLASVTINTSLDPEFVQDIIGGMVETNTEAGIAVTYDDATGKINFDVADFDINLAGAVVGTGTITDLATVTINTSLDPEFVQDIIGGMVETNTEAGIAVTYDDVTGKINFDVADFDIALTGAITGTGTVTDLGNVSITTAIEADSVQLGVHTVGEYVRSVTGIDGIVITGPVAESADLNIGFDYTNATFLDAVKDAAGSMIGAQAGIAVTYDSVAKTLSYDVADFVLTLEGAVTGTATVTDLGNTTITTTLDPEAVQDIIGGMVETNTENGIAVTYDDATGKINFDVADFNITLTGAIAGTATVTDLGDVTIMTSLEEAPSIRVEQIAVTGVDTLAALTTVWGGQLINVFVNGQHVGTPGGAFSINPGETQIVWNSVNAGFSIDPTDIVVVEYDF